MSDAPQLIDCRSVFLQLNKESSSSKASRGAFKTPAVWRQWMESWEECWVSETKIDISSETHLVHRQVFFYGVFPGTNSEKPVYVGL